MPRCYFQTSLSPSHAALLLTKQQALKTAAHTHTQILRKTTLLLTNYSRDVVVSGKFTFKYVLRVFRWKLCATRVQRPDANITNRWSTATVLAVLRRRKYYTLNTNTAVFLMLPPKLHLSPVFLNPTYDRMSLHTQIFKKTYFCKWRKTTFVRDVRLLL